MTTQPEDRELEEYLAGGSRISQAYRSLPRDEPPAALDARVRFAAGQDPAVRRRPWQSALRWVRPVALAATVVVSFSLILRLGELGSPETGRGVPPAPSVPVELIAPGAVDGDVAPPVSIDLRQPGRIAAAPPVEVTVTARKRQESLQDVPVAVTALDTERGGPQDVTVSAPRLAQPAAVGELAPGTPPAPGPTGTAAPGKEAIEQAIRAARARVAARDAAARDEDIVVTARRGREFAAAERQAPAEPRAAADERLRAILALYDAGRFDAAATALADFARDFPADPIAALVTKPAQ